jgi:hypothetical protein
MPGDLKLGPLISKESKVFRVSTNHNRVFGHYESNARDESNGVYRQAEPSAGNTSRTSTEGGRNPDSSLRHWGDPTEKLWYTTSRYADGSTRSKAIPGHEFSGIVAGLAILADEKCR